MAGWAVAALPFTAPWCARGAARDKEPPAHQGHYQSQPREGSALWFGTTQTACLHGDLARRGTATSSRMDTGPWAGRAVPPEPATAPQPALRQANESPGNRSSPRCPKQKEKNKLKC